MSTTLLCRESDSEWINHAMKNLNIVKIYSYGKNFVMIKNLKGSTDITKGSPSFKNALMKACNNIQVDYPGDTMDLIRDYELIKDATSLYFTGYFEIDKSRLHIKGRETWIIEMFVEKLGSLPLYPVYMFSEQMFCWSQLNSEFKWLHISHPPRPTGLYIGISSEPISTTAKLEISLL